jgi:hypothetical protein
VNKHKIKRLKTAFWILSVLITIFISFYVDTGASAFERIIFSPVILAGVVFSIGAAGFALGIIVVICEWVLKTYKKIEDWLSR